MVKVTVTGFVFIRWNHDSNIWFALLLVFQFFFFFFPLFLFFVFLFFVFLACFRDHPSLTVHVRKLECGVKRVPLLWSRSWSRWGFGTSVNVCPDNISDRLKLVWWCIIMSQSIIREYYFAIFTVIAKIVSARFSEILQRLQFNKMWEGHCSCNCLRIKFVSQWFKCVIVTFCVCNCVYITCETDYWLIVIG